MKLFVNQSQFKDGVKTRTINSVQLKWKSICWGSSAAGMVEWNLNRQTEELPQGTVLDHHGSNPRGLRLP